MASIKPPISRALRHWLWLAYAGAVALFLVICVPFFVRGKGFTYLERFGTNQSEHYIRQLKELNHYEEEDSDGYDGQHYAQIAMRPWLSNPGLKRAVDNLAYRARRILFCWTAYGLAMGDPSWALQIYAVQNIVCWLVLAGLMLRWFPPVNWGNFLRWAGVLYSAGLCLSVRSALVDGPSLLLIALGMLLIETGRPGWSALLLGVSGLGKETNILAAASLPLPARDAGLRAWFAVAARWALALLPIAAWMICLHFWLGASGGAGMRNFAWPFSGYFTKWAEITRQVCAGGINSITEWNLLTMMITLTVQWLFFALRPRWSDPWWRLGAVYSVLLLVLGDAVWEGYPGAASRVVLPMMLAFNVLVPRGRKLGWWLVLLLGNLTMIFSAVEFLKPPGREDFHLSGPRELVMIEKTGHTIEAVFNREEWYLPERSHFDFWRWSRGSAGLVLRNPQSFAVVADVSFDMKSNDPRLVTLLSGGKELWNNHEERVVRDVVLRNIRLDPGDTPWRFETDRPPEFPPSDDLRKLGFSLRHLTIRVTGRAPTPPASAK